MRAILALLLLLLPIGCSPARAQLPPPALREKPLALAVDTDMGADDVLALLYLLQRPDVDLRALTVSGAGIARCPGGVRLARALLAHAGQLGVPVACGREAPLSGERVLPAPWRDAADAIDGLGLPPAPEAPSTEDAARLLLSAIRERGPITVLALGPLTNLAEAFQAEPQAASLLERVVVMGGAVDVPGNLGPAAVDNRAAEWNMYIDPTAAAHVLSSGARIDLVPLDATNALPLTADFARRLEASSPTPAAALASQLLAGQLTVGAGDLYLWDPLAAVLAVDERLAPWVERRLAVVVNEGPESGRTVARPDGAAVRVAGVPEQAAVERHLIDSLSGRYGAAEAR